MARVVCPICATVIKLNPPIERDVVCSECGESVATATARRGKSTKQFDRTEPTAGVADNGATFSLAEAHAVPESTAPGSTAGFVAEKKRKSKKRVNQPVALPGATPRDPWWTAWFDPASILWLLFLPPALGMGGTGMLLGLASIGQGGVGAKPLIFGIFLTVLFLGIVCQHVFSIIGQWARGERYDPDWPGMNGTEAAFSFGYVCLCVLAASLPTIAILYFLPASSTPRVLVYLAWGLCGLWFFAYLPIALVLVALTEDIRTISPHIVIPAIGVLWRGLLGYWLEQFLHWLALVSVLVGAVWVMPDIVAAFLLFLLFWALFVLSASRLGRHLGMLYHRHEKRLQWFR